MIFLNISLISFSPFNQRLKAQLSDDNVYEQISVVSYSYVSPYGFLKFFNHGAIVEEWPVEAAKKGILSFFFLP